ncbi:MAG: hypothetical protein ACPLXC_00925 [Candidatus Pacearchaeota archaeon]
MLVKIMGAFDLFVALILFILAMQAHIWSWLVILLILILAIKSLPFILSFCVASIIDIAVMVILLLSLFLSINAIILIIAAFAIAQKGVFSLL